jgi:hypothetical protein
LGESKCQPLVGQISTSYKIFTPMSLQMFVPVADGFLKRVCEQQKLEKSFLWKTPCWKKRKVSA